MNHTLEEFLAAFETARDNYWCEIEAQETGGEVAYAVVMAYQEFEQDEDKVQAAILAAHQQAPGGCSVKLFEDVVDSAIDEGVFPSWRITIDSTTPQADFVDQGAAFHFKRLRLTTTDWRDVDLRAHDWVEVAALTTERFPELAGMPMPHAREFYVRDGSRLIVEWPADGIDLRVMLDGTWLPTHLPTVLNVIKIVPQTLAEFRAALDKAELYSRLQVDDGTPLIWFRTWSAELLSAEQNTATNWWVIRDELDITLWEGAGATKLMIKFLNARPPACRPSRKR